MISPAGTHTIDYQTNNWLQKRTLPNGAYTNYTYNEVGMPESIVSKTSAHSTLTSFGSFSYDGVFNMLGMSATFTGLTDFSGISEKPYSSGTRSSVSFSKQVQEFGDGWGSKRKIEKNNDQVLATARTRILRCLIAS